MELREYFENTEGIGILSTADSEGNVDAAVYARPHIMEDGSLALIMRDRLSHANLQSNPKAVYLFKEAGQGYKGKRLYLKKVSEEHNTQRLFEMRRRSYAHDSEGDLFLVFFEITKELPLVGSGQE
ncbi:MAG: pyridoxamine 5'-phosphate oxidase family protein [Thermodesulfobacteriota bacterium]